MFLFQDLKEMEIDDTESEPYILYQRLHYLEWHQNSDAAQQKIALNNPVSSPPSYLSPWRFFKKSQLDKTKFLRTEYPWQLAASQDGKVIAVLQESLLEIRTAKEEYAVIVGKVPFPIDQHPNLRKVLWSSDNSFLAVARDNGAVHVFNLLGSVIATVQPDDISGKVRKNNTNVIRPVAGLAFIQPNLKNTKWSNELFIFYTDGKIKSLLLSSLEDCDSEENANCSLEQYFPQGVTSVAAHNLHHVVAIAGSSPSKRDGISIWRVLNEYPHLKIASGFERDIPAARSFLQFFSAYPTMPNENTVIKMKISPNGELLASLYYSGDIALWAFPGIRLLRRWPLLQQPGYNKINPRDTDNVKDEDSFLPVDICWWSDIALAIARKSGAITVCSLTTLENLLGNSPEFFLNSPQISSIHGSRPSVLALECETANKFRTEDDTEDAENEDETSVLQESIQAALYSFTDIQRFEPKRKTPRTIIRTYRLHALQISTPEELYAKKIEIQDYEAALMLAYKYELDCDLVYQSQWKSSNVSQESIKNYLDKIKNTYWVVNECIRRVPDTIGTAKQLLEFGLKKTEMNFKSMEDLDSEQKKMVSLRRQILKFLDSLFMYQKIIIDPSKYSAVEYDDFRRKCPLVNAVLFARKENPFAVSVMLTYMGNVILKYWLPILSNFPETFSPLLYRSLLPQIVANKIVSWNVKKIRNPDWSEKDKPKESASEREVSREYLYKDDLSLKHFESDVLTPALVKEWFIRRIYEIEKNTGLVENALLFAGLGKEKNVKGLDSILFSLKTLYSLVYVVQNVDLTLSNLESLSLLEQAKLFLAKTTKETFVSDLNQYIQPFGTRCESRGLSTFYDLIQGVLLWVSVDNLDLPLQFFLANKETNGLAFQLSMAQIMTLAMNCIYNCSNYNQLDNAYFILECLPVRNPSANKRELDCHDKVDKMENHLEVCDVLHHYKINKSMKWVLENEGHKSSALKVMQQMANYTKDETLDFTELESDLQQIQCYMFKSMDIQYCFELVAFTQLNCECVEIISSAAYLMQCCREEPNKVISFDKSLDLIIRAAKAHFQRAASCNDPAIKLAQACLTLINEPHPLICQELDLIESVQLLQDFQVQILPTQVRNCSNKMKLIEHCLHVNNSAYKSSQRLIQLAHALRIYGRDRRKRECEVMILMVKYALKEQDYEFSREMCSRLVNRNYPSAWPLVRTVAQEDPDLSRSTRREFIAFAILHCSKKELRSLTEISRQLRREEYFS